MGIEINVKTYLTFSVSMDFKPSISAITYYMNDLLMCRVSVINSAVLWVHNVRKKYTSKIWTFIKWSWVFINWTRKGPPSTYKVVRCGVLWCRLQANCLYIWRNGRESSDILGGWQLFFLSFCYSSEHDPSRHQIYHQNQNEFMFPTLIKLD